MKDWLQFWRHFKKIHYTEITDEDKFQEAETSELVNSFSPTKENFKNVY